MPVSKKLKFIFLKRYRSGLFYSLYNFVLSFGYGENKKNWLSKLKFPKLFSSCFMNACSKKIKVYIFEKISFRTILQYLPFCSLSFGYGENKKNWLSKLKFPKLFSSDFMNACSKKINIYIFEKISSRTILQSLQFCSLIWLRRK